MVRKEAVTWETPLVGSLPVSICSNPGFHITSHLILRSVQSLSPQKELQTGGVNPPGRHSGGSAGHSPGRQPRMLAPVFVPQSSLGGFSKLLTLYWKFSHLFEPLYVQSPHCG
jgi:hypothetical protein